MLAKHTDDLRMLSLAEWLPHYLQTTRTTLLVVEPEAQTTLGIIRYRTFEPLPLRHEGRLSYDEHGKTETVPKRAFVPKRSSELKEKLYLGNCD